MSPLVLLWWTIELFFNKRCLFLLEAVSRGLNLPFQEDLLQFLSKYSCKAAAVDFRMKIEDPKLGQIWDMKS